MPGVFPGGKGGRFVTLATLPPSCAFVIKSRNLNLLETCGPLQAYKRTALPPSSTLFQNSSHQSYSAIAPHQPSVSQCHGTTSAISLTVPWHHISHQSHSAMAPHQSSVLQCHGTTSQNNELNCTPTKAYKVAC